MDFKLSPNNIVASESNGVLKHHDKAKCFLFWASGHHGMLLSPSHAFARKHEMDKHARRRAKKGSFVKGHTLSQNSRAIKEQQPAKKDTDKFAKLTNLIAKIDAMVRQRVLGRYDAPLVIPGRYSRDGGLRGAAMLHVIANTQGSQ